MAAGLIAGAVAAPIVGGLLGQDAARKDAKRARQMMERALQQYAGLEAPSVEDQKVFLEQLSSAGMLTPELMQALQLGPSAMEQVQTDPRLRQQQMDALQSLTQISETGMSPADEATFELVRRNAAQENQAKQGQILQEMQARGQGGSGAELLTRLKANQSATDALQQAQLEQAKAQQAARMQALSQVGNLSSGIRSQDFNEASDVARAKDLVAQYNQQNMQRVNDGNVQARNLAQQANLQNQQRIMDSNVGLRNQQQTHNKGLLQQDFANRMQLATNKANALTGQGSFYQNQAANTAGMYSQIGQGIGTGFASFANRKKTDGET